MPAPKVNIVILNFRRWEDSRDCLESVLRSTYSDYSVFLIDNNSENNSIESLTAWLDNRNQSEIPFGQKQLDYAVLKRSELNNYRESTAPPKITFIQNDTNNGFAAGNNVVLQMLMNQDAFVWLLNPDMTIQEDTLTELVRFAELLPPKSIVGSLVKSYSDRQEILFYGGGRINFLTATVQMAQRSSSIHQLDYISGGCLFTHASNIKALGLLPEKYFVYWEETDWCYRAKQDGYNLSVCPTAVCYDKISSVIGRNFMSDYYYVRNGLMFISKFRRKNIPFVLFFTGIRFLKRIITGQWARARGVFRGAIDFLKMKPDEAQ